MKTRQPVLPYLPGYILDAAGSSLIKISFSEKATKICTIVLFYEKVFFFYIIGPTKVKNFNFNFHNHCFPHFLISNLNFWPRCFRKHFSEPQFWRLLRPCTLLVSQTSQNCSRFFIILESPF